MCDSDSILSQTCVLAVWAHHSPEVAADEAFETFVQDEEHVVQRGPYCAASSVAGLLCSFGRELGPEASSACTAAATQSAVVAVMSEMKVPGLEQSTARVGNVTWKRTMRSVSVPESPEDGVTGGAVRLAPRDFELLSPPEDPLDESDELWRRLKDEMAAGARMMYHCARVFGWRESRPGLAASLPGPADGPKASLDEVLGGDSDGEDQQAPRRPAAGPAEREFAWGVHLSREGRRREILTAKRGQGPKHWVSWEQVMADVRKHKLHRLIAVTAVDRRARERRARRRHKAPAPDAIKSA